MVESFQVATPAHSVLVDITDAVVRRVQDSAVSSGVCILFVPHTTAAITINEGADPDVADDLVTALNKLVPWRDSYKHREGNSAAHIKTTLVGSSVHLIIDDGRLLLGTWQRIFLCEFDGPRTRQVRMKLLPTG